MTTPSRDEQIAEYRYRLARHDWFYRYSDDSRVYARGQSEWESLCMMRADLDPSNAIWNEIAPLECRRR